MSAEMIREHFTQYLGVDVGVSFRDPHDPREVTLYRPDRLPDLFVAWAFEALEKAAPRVAWNIDRLLVSFEGPHGRTQRGVTLTSKAHLGSPADSAPKQKKRGRRQ